MLLIVFIILLIIYANSIKFRSVSHQHKFATNPPTNIRSRPILHSQIIDASEALTRGFFDDPIMNTFMSQNQKVLRFQYFFEGWLRLQYSIDKDYTFSDDLSCGAAIWSNINKWQMSLKDLLRFLPICFVSCGWHPINIYKLLNMFVIMETEHHRIKEPHYYLHTVAVDTSFHGRGFGTEILRPILEKCDLEKVHAYLESSNPRNVPFYQRQGFEIVKKRLVNGCVMHFMLRKPSS